jgi:hypothetical protein
VPLLAMNALVQLQNLIDDRDLGFQLGSPDRRLTTITRRQ